ncbi:hypothetical protein CF326_g8737 [Tilletia indica]|nr:hypothetical protein CF326_g8737 [Tilletia indica]
MIPPNLRVSSNSVDDLIQHVYPDLDNVVRTSDSRKIEYFQDRVLLFPRNKDVDACNEAVLQTVDKPSTHHLSSDSAVVDSGTDSTLYSTEFLNGVNLPGLPAHDLHLKAGVPIILLRNLDPTQGLCNGTRLIVCSASRSLITAKIMNGNEDFIGVTVFIPRIGLNTKEGALPFTLLRRQFPVKLAFAMTINKAQGQSVSTVGVDLRQPVFSHGQLYVALSRAKDPSLIKLLCSQQGTANVVFHNALPHL